LQRLCHVPLDLDLQSLLPIDQRELTVAEEAHHATVDAQNVGVQFLIQIEAVDQVQDAVNALARRGVARNFAHGVLPRFDLQHAEAEAQERLMQPSVIRAPDVSPKGLQKVRANDGHWRTNRMTTCFVKGLHPDIGVGLIELHAPVPQLNI